MWAAILDAIGGAVRREREWREQNPAVVAREFRGRAAAARARAQTRHARGWHRLAKAAERRAEVLEAKAQAWEQQAKSEA